MKRIMWFICFVSAFQCSITLSQTKNPEFSFRLFFEDGAGNRDTVTIGYASDATIGIDSIYGEQDMSGNAFDADFEVRVSSDVDPIISSDFSPHSKTKIDFVDCGNEFNVKYLYPISIRMNNQPLTIRWNQSLFDSLNFPCHQAAFFAPSRFGVSYSNAFLNEGINFRLSSDSIMIRDLDNWVTDSYEAPTEGGGSEKINLIWFVVTKEIDKSVSIEDSLRSSFNWYYHSRNESLEITTDMLDKKLILSVYDLTSKTYYSETLSKIKEHSINVSFLPKGLYFFSVRMKGAAQIVMSGKFMR